MKKGVIFLVLLLLIVIFPQKIAAEQKASLSSATFATQPAVGEDSRAKILKTFLKSYNSPLSAFAKDFVQAADTNELDWRLLVAISGVESTFGQELPFNSHNAWGWGIYGNNAIYFSSYNEAIETISKALRENYINTWGAQDVYQIGRLYAASPTWAQRVAYFMRKIDEFASNDPASALSLSL